MLVQLESSSAVLVMIGSKSVSISNHCRAIQRRSEKFQYDIDRQLTFYFFFLSVVKLLCLMCLYYFNATLYGE